MKKTILTLASVFLASSAFANQSKEFTRETARLDERVQTLIAMYNSDLSTLKNMKDLKTQQNAVMKLLFKITDYMVGNLDSLPQGQERINFFTMNKNPLTIPFYLVGLTVPYEVSGKVMPVLVYDQWFQANMEILPIFNDPLALADTIGHNMQEIIRDAKISAINYLKQYHSACPTGYQMTAAYGCLPQGNCPSGDSYYNGMCVNGL